MMPDLNGKRVLDLGCGFGEHCKRFVECGAQKVVGIDISEKMLEVARAENTDPKITYINMPMEEIAQLQEKFDVACADADPSYWLSDGVHPTPMGHEIIKRAWLKAFNELEQENA
jgi:SAM-dependent methyltransferase